MAGFDNTLVTTIVATVVSVLAFFALILVLALYWTNIVRRIAPNRFPEPMSEKSWPGSRKSIETSSGGSSPAPSQRSSTVPSLPRAFLRT